MSGAGERSARRSDEATTGDERACDPVSQPEVVLGIGSSRRWRWRCELHAHQARKGSDIPYVSHLVAVAGLVLEHGGDEDQAIAALLHDGPEDQGGEATLAAIRERFGPRVAAIVAACSDTFESPKPPWRARKEAYIARPRRQGTRRLAGHARRQGPQRPHDRRRPPRARSRDPRPVQRRPGRHGLVLRHARRAPRQARAGPLAAELAALAAEMRELAER